MLIAKDKIIGAESPPGLIDAARALLQKPVNASTRLWGDAATGDYLLEQSPGHQGHILLIGAGHVGKAVAEVLGRLPFIVTWADNRPEQYPDEIAANITARCTPHLERAVDDAPEDSIYLVMTYSHDLDYALCARVLERGDFRYLGLIGSKTKRARFRKNHARSWYRSSARRPGDLSDRPSRNWQQGASGDRGGDRRAALGTEANGELRLLSGCTLFVGCLAVPGNAYDRGIQAFEHIEGDVGLPIVLGLFTL